MKIKLFSSTVLSCLLSLTARAQLTFVYDQQSADENAGGGGATTIQSNHPIGQSFTPSLSSIGFIRLYLIDRTLNNLGATVYVSLRSDSITGPILGSTDPVFMPDGFGVGTGNRGYMNFYFSTPVALTPGVTYYFQPIVTFGDQWAIAVYNFNYLGGTAFFQGLANPNSDLWFREGIVVPEPSSALLILIAGGVLVYVRGAHIRKRSLR